MASVFLQSMLQGRYVCPWPWELSFKTAVIAAHARLCSCGEQPRLKANASAPLQPVPPFSMKLMSQWLLPMRAPAEFTVDTESLWYSLSSHMHASKKLDWNKSDTASYLKVYPCRCCRVVKGSSDTAVTASAPCSSTTCQASRLDKPLSVSSFAVALVSVDPAVLSIGGLVKTISFPKQLRSGCLQVWVS